MGHSQLEAPQNLGEIISNTTVKIKSIVKTGLGNDLVLTLYTGYIDYFFMKKRLIYPVTLGLTRPSVRPGLSQTRDSEFELWAKKIHLSPNINHFLWLILPNNFYILHERWAFQKIQANFGLRAKILRTQPSPVFWHRTNCFTAHRYMYLRAPICGYAGSAYALPLFPPRPV